MDTGIGRDGYSIIGQGKIDEILDEGAKRASYIANKTLLKVRKTVGLYVHK